jgi:hypothetical protein
MSKLKKNSPQRTLKKKYDINFSMGDTFINKEDLNIVYTSRYMAPHIHRSEKKFIFVGPSLFLRKSKTIFRLTN